MWTRATLAEGGRITLGRIFNVGLPENHGHLPNPSLCLFVRKSMSPAVKLLGSLLMHRLLKKEEDKVDIHRREMCRGEHRDCDVATVTSSCQGHILRTEVKITFWQQDLAFYPLPSSQIFYIKMHTTEPTHLHCKFCLAGDSARAPSFSKNRKS